MLEITTGLRDKGINSRGKMENEKIIKALFTEICENIDTLYKTKCISVPGITFIMIPVIENRPYFVLYQDEVWKHARPGGRLSSEALLIDWLFQVCQHEPENPARILKRFFQKLEFR